MDAETAVAVLGGYVAGVATLLTVEWFRNNLHQRRVRRITKAWFDHRGYVSVSHLVRDVGIVTYDPDLLFKATLLHTLEQQHPTRAAQTPSHMGLTPDVIRDLEGLRPSSSFTFFGKKIGRRRDG